jgi:hypothetical protein
MTDLAVHRIVVRNNRPGTSARAQAETLLRAAAPTGADHSVLIVRRLVLAGTDRRYARDRVAELRRHAARPASGWVDPGAEAVVFSDEAEALACLTADLASDEAGQRWYWRSRLHRSSARGESTLAGVWLAEVRWLPSAFALLERRTGGLAQRAVALLSAVECEMVLAALLPAAAPQAGPAATSPHEALDKPDETLATPGPETTERWLRLLPPPVVALSLAGRTLVAAAAVLAVEPAAPTVALMAWVRGIGDQAQLSALTPVGSHEQEDLKPNAAAMPGLAPPPTTSEPLDRTLSPPPSRARLQRRPAMPQQHRIDPERRLFDDQRPPEAPRAAPVHWRRTATGAVAPAAVHGASLPAEPWPDGMRTDYATVFYLLNLVISFAEPDVDWIALKSFGRRVLRGRPRARHRVRDPIWSLITEQAGHDLRRVTRAPKWWSAALRFLDEHQLSPSVFEQPGRVLLTRTHVDVVLSIEQIDLAVRISGLDQDPGWVPSLGRIVAFHFEEQL